MTITLRNPSNDPAPNRVFGDAPVKGVSVIWHNGNDYGWGEGTQVYAAAAGRVSSVRWSSTTRTNHRGGGYGNYIIIDHEDGYSTLYAHLPNSPLLVYVGELLEAGERIGTMGNTGNSSGVHLHFELRLNGRIINPNPYFGRTTLSSSTTKILLEPATEKDTALIMALKDTLTIFTAKDRGQLVVGTGFVREIIGNERLDLINRLGVNTEIVGTREWDVLAEFFHGNDEIQSIAAAQDSATIARAVVASLGSQVSGGVDIPKLVADLDAALADNFAAIPGSVVGGFKAAL